MSVGGTPRRVAALILPDLSMESRFPDALGTLTGLRTLDLAHNRLNGEIPQALADLPNLEAIALAGTQFTG